MPALAAGTAPPVQPIRWSPESKVPNSAGVTALTTDEDIPRLNHHESLAVHDVDPGASCSIAAAHNPALHLQPFADTSTTTLSALQPRKLMSAASAMPDHAALSFQPKYSSEQLHLRQPAQPLPAFSDNRRIAAAAGPGAALAVQQASAHLHPAASSALQQKAALLAQSSADTAPLKPGTPTWEVQEPAAGGQTPAQPLDEVEAIHPASPAGEPSSR